MNQPFAFNKGKPLVTEEAGVIVRKVGVHLGAEVTGRRSPRATVGCPVQGGRGRAG